MTVNKRSKISRQRGSHTHGWGAMKKHRGSGNRGGAGMAGTGKRADSKKPSIWKDTHYFGKFGFKKKGQIIDIKPINIEYLEKNLDRLLSDKSIAKEGDFYVIDVKKIGFNKVLGCGKISNKYKITSDFFSKKAQEKIRSAGGEAIISKKDKIKGAKPEPNRSDRN